MKGLSPVMASERRRGVAVLYVTAVVLVMVGAMIGAGAVFLAAWQSGGDAGLDCLLRTWPEGATQDQLVAAEYAIAPSRLTCDWQEGANGALISQVYRLNPGTDAVSLLLVVAGIVLAALATWRFVRR
ncbi:hypothetical protein EQW78_15605 [Oerskovia turbata]|uniref:Uncharacterized protein n=1 Tax=Oerskovia turbata TaxID=1713 RepID=A0A4Q1KRN3_9CELL|nr:hypothetical protein [Oerskovia turbata]RXR22042.1 hypothetical protein EQW73_16975 [Oerskovia turbata]RXR31999.1 hypothetical protein EQW78_15605 [Oerskovia turbata]TGJ96892.1 hypothetical protein DLJ96_02200 [Actinotalea fermentans ATCC 43279 = JCM 9966 = DSM 3133]